MKYETGKPIGSGGMGQVVKSWAPALKRYVALKILRRDDPESAARMMREARAQARVEHPSVCQVYEVGETDGRPYIAMQFIDGKPLNEAVSERSVDEKVRLMKTVAEAVQAASDLGLGHSTLYRRTKELDINTST